MLTSLAPSPMARVTALLCLFTSSTTWAFCIGVTRQQMTVLHKQARSSKTCSSCGSRAWACRENTYVHHTFKTHHYHPITSTTRRANAEQQLDVTFPPSCCASCVLLKAQRGSSSSVRKWMLMKTSNRAEGPQQHSSPLLITDSAQSAAGTELPDSADSITTTV